MRRELRSVLILFVLMLVIWVLVARLSYSWLWLLVLAGAFWATLDFLRALWGFFWTGPELEDEDPLS